MFEFDPVKWVDDLICSIANGPGERIEWIGQSGADGEMLLRAYGVRVWGRTYDYGRETHYGVTVRRRQARWAAGLLAGHGFCVVRPAHVRPICPRTAWGVDAPAQGLAGAIVGLFGSKARVNRRKGK